MCRQNQFWGFMQMAFGFGILVGLWMEGGFLAYCFGVAMIALGCSSARKRMS